MTKRNCKSRVNDKKLITFVIFSSAEFYKVKGFVFAIGNDVANANLENPSFIECF